MGRHQEIAADVQRLIRQRRLRPGDALPSDRELAKQFRVAHSTVRYANDLLCRQGLLQRRHGRGTFLAQPARERSEHSRHRRLGLLYVDMTHPLHPNSQQLTFDIHRAALKAGYELVVEEMRTEQLLQSKVPEMIQRRSVDAVVLDGRVREHHLRFLEDHSILYVVTGNCPIGTGAPQFRTNIEQLVFQITRELLQAGKRPVWCDVDPAQGDVWFVDLERYRGYANAIQEHAPGDAPLHLCPIEPHTVTKVAAKLSRAGLENAAVIVDHWASAMLPDALAMHTTKPEQLLIVPMPTPNLCQALPAPNVLHWSAHITTDLPAERAVQSLVAVLEGRTETIHSASLETKCNFIATEGAPRMELKTHWENQDSFVCEQHGQGRGWRHMETTTTKKDDRAEAVIVSSNKGV